jgi:hypothetical protein
MSTFTVKVNQRTTPQGTSGFEGTVELQGAKPTKLTRKDGTTLFPTTSALKASARAFGTRFGAEVQYDEPVKKAAKKSVKAQTANTTSTTCATTANTASTTCASKKATTSKKSKK